MGLSRATHVKGALGGNAYQVRKDQAMRRSRRLPSPRSRRGGKTRLRPGARPRVSWPVALRRVRAWLEPWTMRARSWRGWSAQPPSPALQALLAALGQGHPIALYDRS